MVDVYNHIVYYICYKRDCVGCIAQILLVVNLFIFTYNVMLYWFSYLFSYKTIISESGQNMTNMLTIFILSMLKHQVIKSFLI